MYCPEDGATIQPAVTLGNKTSYLPCGKCGTVWMWNGEYGRYEVEHTTGFDIPKPNPPDVLGDLLKATGADRRSLGVNVLVANIVDIMEKKAEEEGQSTYYTGTYAVGLRSYGLIHAGLTCERYTGVDTAKPLAPFNTLRWVSFMGDDWERLTRQQAIEVLLAERS